MARSFRFASVAARSSISLVLGVCLALLYVGSATAWSASPVPTISSATSLATFPATSPAATDSDGDGLSDAFEVQYGLNPNAADSDGDGLLDPAEDLDGDGLSNLGEQRAGTSPLRTDTDGDGVSDWNEDADHDGVSNGAQQDRRHLPSRLKPSLDKAYDDVPPSYRDGCHSGVYETTIHPCLYGDRNGGVTVAVFGDSHAAQWLPALIAIGNQQHWRIRSMTKSGCPSVTVRFKEGKYAGAEKSCRSWRKHAITWLAAHPPDLIVVTNYRSYELLDASGHRLRGAARQSAWGAGLAKTLQALPHSSQRYVLGDTPAMAVDPVACLRQHPTDIAACETRRSKAESTAHDDAERSAAGSSNATFGSLTPQVCPYDPCPVVVGRLMMWREQTHLTATYAKQLAPSLRNLLVGQLPTPRATRATKGAAAEAATESATAPATSSSTDTDGDGLSNVWETHWGVSDPLVADTDRNGVPDGAEDPDADGLGNLGEQRVGTDPTKPDSNGNGIDDARDDADGNGVADGLQQDHRPLPRGLTPSLARAPDDTPISYRDGCHTGPGSSTIHPCAFGYRSGHVTVALFGDSHALQWEPPLIKAAAHEHWRLIVLTKSGCPSVDVRFRPGAFPNDAQPCRDWRSHAVAWLRSHAPDLVVISNSRGYTIVDQKGNKVPRDPAWAKGLRRTLSRMPSSTARLVLGDTVHLGRDPVPCLERHGRNMARCETARGAAWNHKHDAAEESAAHAEDASFTTLNLVVCSYDPCPVVMGHVMMWRNNGHLTATFARGLWRGLDALLSGALGLAPHSQSTAVLLPPGVRDSWARRLSSAE